MVGVVSTGPICGADLLAASEDCGGQSLRLHVLLGAGAWVKSHVEAS